MSNCKKDPQIQPLKFYNYTGILSVGQTGLFYLKDTTPTEMKLLKVTDSRCPTGVDCIWQGEIVAEVLIDKTHSFKIASQETSVKPVYYKGYHIVIIDATPYPNIHKIIDETDYKVTFKFVK